MEGLKKRYCGGPALLGQKIGRNEIINNSKLVGHASVQLLNEMDNNYLPVLAGKEPFHTSSKRSNHLLRA
jgi:hypothetical protein